MITSNVLDSALTRCALFYSMCDLNVQCSLIREIMLSKFELVYNAADASKKIYYVKREDEVDHSKVTW